MLKEIICAGLGGQGVLTAGKLMMYAAYKKNMSVTWFPSYGNAMRGGPANCNVVISDTKVASPYAEHPDILFAMAERAIDEYMDSMKKGGIILINSSLVGDNIAIRDDLSAVRVPVVEISHDLKNERAANICLLGSLVRHTDIFSKDEFIAYLCEYFKDAGKDSKNPKNIEVFEAGYSFA